MQCTYAYGVPPSRFSLKFYPTEFEVVPVMGVLGRDDQVYFSLHNVRHLLGTKVNAPTRPYVAVAPECNLRRRNYPMVQEKDLVRLLKGSDRGSRLCRMLSDQAAVHYLGVSWGEHVLSACPCAHFGQGVLWHEWVDDLRRDLWRRETALPSDLKR